MNFHEQFRFVTSVAIRFWNGLGEFEIFRRALLNKLNIRNIIDKMNETRIFPSLFSVRGYTHRPLKNSKHCDREAQPSVLPNPDRSLHTLFRTSWNTWRITSDTVMAPEIPL